MKIPHRQFGLRGWRYGRSGQPREKTHIISASPYKTGAASKRRKVSIVPAFTHPPAWLH